MLLDEPHQIGEGRLLIGRHDLPGHDVGNPARMSRHEVVGGARFTIQEARQPGLPGDGAGLGPTKEIGLAHNADNFTLIVDNRDGADTGTEHELGRIEDQFLDTNADNALGHDVLGLHDVLLRLRMCLLDQFAIRE